MTRRYVRVKGDHLRAAVEPLAETDCHPDKALINYRLGSVRHSEGEA